MKIRIRFATTVLIAMLLIVLSACGGDGKATSSDQTTTAPSTGSEDSSGDDAHSDIEKKEILPGVTGWLDHTETIEYEYDSEGRVTSWTDSYGLSATCEYDAEGKLTETFGDKEAPSVVMVYEDDEKYMDSLNDVMFDYRIFSDDLGITDRLSDIYSKPGKRLAKRTEKGSPDYTEEYEYSDDGLLTKFTREASDGTHLDSIVYEYNEQDGLVSVQSEISGDEVENLKDKKSYKYEILDNGDKVKITEIDSEYPSDMIVEYKHSDDGNLQEKKISYDDRYFITKYDNDGKITLDAEVEGKNTLLFATEYEYNEHGDCIKETHWVGENQL